MLNNDHGPVRVSRQLLSERLPSQLVTTPAAVETTLEAEQVGDEEPMLVVPALTSGEFTISTREACEIYADFREDLLYYWRGLSDYQDLRPDARQVLEALPGFTASHKTQRLQNKKFEIAPDVEQIKYTFGLLDTLTATKECKAAQKEDMSLAHGGLWFGGRTCASLTVSAIVLAGVSALIELVPNWTFQKILNGATIYLWGQFVAHRIAEWGVSYGIRRQFRERLENVLRKGEIWPEIDKLRDRQDRRLKEVNSLEDQIAQLGKEYDQRTAAAEASTEEQDDDV